MKGVGGLRRGDDAAKDDFIIFVEVEEAAVRCQHAGRVRAVPRERTPCGVDADEADAQRHVHSRRLALLRLDDGPVLRRPHPVRLRLRREIRLVDRNHVLHSQRPLRLRSRQVCRLDLPQLKFATLQDSLRSCHLLRVLQHGARVPHARLLHAPRDGRDAHVHAELLLQLILHVLLPQSRLVHKCVYHVLLRVDAQLRHAREVLPPTRGERDDPTVWSPGEDALLTRACDPPGHRLGVHAKIVRDFLARRAVHHRREGIPDHLIVRHASRGEPVRASVGGVRGKIGQFFSVGPAKVSSPIAVLLLRARAVPHIWCHVIIAPFAASHGRHAVRPL